MTMGRKSILLNPKYTPFKLDPAEDYIYGYTGEEGKRVTDWKEIYSGLISGKIKTEGAKLLSEYESFNSKIKFGGMDTMRRLALVRYLVPSIFGMLDPDTGNPAKLSRNDPDSAFYGITFKQLSRDRSEGALENKEAVSNDTGLATNRLSLGGETNTSDAGRFDRQRTETDKEINKYKDELVEYVTKSEYDNQLKGLAQYIAAVNTELNIADDTREIEALNARAQAIQTNMARQREMNRRARSSADIRRRLALRGSGTFRPKIR